MKIYRISNNSFLYHGTTMGRAINIAKNGLQSGVVAGHTLSEHAYFSDSELYAQSYADRKGGRSGVVIRVKKTSDFIEDENTGLSGDFKTDKFIHPDQIEIKIGRNWVSTKDFLQYEMWL
jgi:hypothetical protein